jgi:hypothetical protein
MNKNINETDISPALVKSHSSELFIPSHLLFTNSIFHSRQFHNSPLLATSPKTHIPNLSSGLRSEGIGSVSGTLSFAVLVSVILVIVVFLIITGLLVWFFITKQSQMQSTRAEESTNIEIDDDQLAELVEDSLNWTGNSANSGLFWGGPIGHSLVLEPEETQL